MNANGRLLSVRVQTNHVGAAIWAANIYKEMQAAAEQQERLVEAAVVVPQQQQPPVGSGA